MPLTRYMNTVIQVTDENNMNMSGTYLFAKYLDGLFPEKTTDILKHFVELVRQWDTWDWYPDNLEAKNLNDLLYIKGINYFVKEMSENLIQNTCFNEFDGKLLEYNASKKDLYFRAKEKAIYFMDVQGYSAAVVVAESYASEFGNYILEKHPRVELVVIVGAKNIGLRTNREYIDVSEIAKVYGGGGHQKASGFPIPEDVTLEYIESIFDLEIRY